MICKAASLFLALALACVSFAASQCIGSNETAMEYVQNGGFENGAAGGWWPFDREGFVRVATADHPGGCGAWASRIDTHYTRASCPRNGGMYQLVTLNQASARPVRISAWSKAENVSGTINAGYSLYTDVTFQDGSNAWGVFVPFPNGTTAWNKKSLVINTTVPIASLYVYLLFRQHTGVVYFDQASVQEVISHDTPLNKNLLVNPSFDMPTNCSVAHGWEALAENCSYMMCDESIPNYMIRSSPGYIATLGDMCNDSTNDSTAGSNGASQKIVFPQPVTNSMNLSAWTWINNNDTGSWDLIVEFNIVLIVTYTDGTTAMQSSDCPRNSLGYFETAVTFVPTKAVVSAEVQLRFNGGGSGAVVWDDVSLVLL